jgi:hypothetical protein
VLTGLAGKFIVMAKAQFSRDQDLSAALVECTLEAGDTSEHSAATLTSPGIATIPFLAPAELNGAVLSCSNDTDVFASNVKLTAIQVDELLP